MSRRLMSVAIAALCASAAARAEPDVIQPIRVEPSQLGSAGFGTALAAADFDDNGLRELVVSDPSRSTLGEPTRALVEVKRRQGETYFTTHESVIDDPGGMQFGFAMARGQFNLVDGEDVAISAPFGFAGDGRIYLLTYSSALGWQRFTVNAADGLGGACGYSLAVGDFNGDGDDDLAAGCPVRTVAGLAVAGAVKVFYGNGDGTFGVEEFTQDTSGVPGTAEAGDGFGWSLAAGDFNGDGVDDLAVGSPYEDLSDVEKAGSVTVLYSTGWGGLSGTDSVVIHQATPGVPGEHEAEDNFGWALASADFNASPLTLTPYDDLAIGVPGDVEHPGGSVTVVNGGANGLTGIGAREITRDSFVPDPAVHPPRGAPSTDNRLGSALLAGDLGRGIVRDLVIYAQGTERPLLPPVGSVVCVAFANVADGLLGEGSSCLRGEDVARGTTSDPAFGASMAIANFDGSPGNELAIGSPRTRRVFVLRDTLFRDGFDGEGQ